MQANHMSYFVILKAHRQKYYIQFAHSCMKCLLWAVRDTDMTIDVFLQINQISSHKLTKINKYKCAHIINQRKLNLMFTLYNSLWLLIQRWIIDSLEVIQRYPWNSWTTQRPSSWVFNEPKLSKRDCLLNYLAGCLKRLARTRSFFRFVPLSDLLGVAKVLLQLSFSQL